MMKIKLYSFWEKGYLYLAISMLLFSIFALNRRIGIYDWQKEVAYFQYIKASFTSFHSFPWFWWNKLENVAWYPAVFHTSNFVSNPETMLFSPFTPLLFLMDVLTYIKFLTLIHCSIGIAGTLVLRRRLKWNSQQFRIYSILFLLSPIIIQHLSLGYTTWLNLFFFPWLVYFIFDEKPLSSILGTSIILGLVLLQGGTHVFIWYAMLISLYFVVKMCIEQKLDFRLLSILCLTVLLSFARIYATVQAYSNFHQQFQVGYNPINFIFWALIPILSPTCDLFINKVWMGVPSWDGGIFWGLAIILVLMLVRNYRRYNHAGDNNLPRQKAYVSLFVASSIMLILAFFSIFGFIIIKVNSVMRLPFIEGAEKYPYRLAIPAYLGFSIVIASYWKELSQSLNELWNRLAGSLIISKIARALEFLAFTFSVCFSVILSIIFSRIILKIFHGMIGEAYYGMGYRWLSQFILVRNVNSFEHYIERVAGCYFKPQVSFFIWLIFFIVLVLFLRRNRWKKRHANEFALAVPFVFVSFIWLLVSISVPYSSYPVQNVLPPEIITHPNISKLKVTANPRSVIIIRQGDSHVAEFFFPGIPLADSKFLYVASNNATISHSKGVMSLIPLDDRAILIRFNSQGYIKAIALTGAVWLMVIGFCMIRLIFSFYKSRIRWVAYEKKNNK
jgi:hypothetical protein